MTRSYSPIYNNPQLKVGDLVVPVSDEHVLHCGSGTYSCAMVVRLEPFAMTSPSGDMLWCTDKHQDHYRKESIATPQMFNAGMKRLPPAEQYRMPVGESLDSHRLGNGLVLLDIVEGQANAIDFDESSSAYGWNFVYLEKDGLWKATEAFNKSQLLRVSTLILKLDKAMGKLDLMDRRVQIFEARLELARERLN